MAERTSEPLKAQHGGRDESQQQQQQDGWPKPSAPASQTKETQVADEQEHEVPDQSPKKSMLRRVKDKAKTYIHKHGLGHSKVDGDEEEGQLEEEESHDQEKGETKGEKKEKAEDSNSNFSRRSPNAGSAVSPGSDASSTQNLSNDAKTASDRPSAPVEIGKGQQEMPTTPAVVNKRNEALENEYYGKDEPEKIDYSEPFAKAPRDPEGTMKSINEDSGVETVPSQEAAKDRWFDADDSVAGAPTEKDPNPSLSHPGSEKFGTTEPLSDEFEDADQDKLGDKDIKGRAGLSDEPQVFKPLQEARSQEFNEDAGRSAPEGSKDTTAMNLGVTGLDASEKDKERGGDDESYREKINDTTPTEYGANVPLKRGNDEQQSIDEPPYEPDRMAEEKNYENSEEGKSSGGQIYDIDPTEKAAEEKNYENSQEGKSSGGQIYDIDPTEKAAEEKNYENSSEGKSSGGQIYDIDPTEKAAAEKNYENSEEGKSYGGQIYDIDPTEKVADSSKFGHGEHQEPAQEETEKRLSTDDVEEAHEETGKSFTDAPSAAESIVSSNPAVEEKEEAHEETGKSFTDAPSAAVSSNPAVEEKEEAHEETGKSLTDKPSAAESIVSSNPAAEEKGEGQAGKSYEDDVEEKPKSDAQDTAAGKSYTDSAKGAFFSVFGYGGAKPAQEKADSTN